MPHDLTPLEVCEHLIGAIEAVGPAIGLSAKAAYNWRHPSSSRAAGDLPSASVMRRLLAYSDQHGLGLTADHLVRGATFAEVDAILSRRGGVAA